MKQTALAVMCLLMVVAMSMPILAQDRPPRPDDRHEDPARPGPGGFGGPGEGPLRPEFRDGPMRQFDMMRGYIDLVDRFSRLSRDPTTSGVAAVIAAADLLKPRGAEAAIEYFNKVMESAKNDAVKRAIRIQLVELYKQTGQQDKALEHLTELINSAPAGGGEQPAR